jgi:carboxyl-terminal processing protease
LAATVLAWNAVRHSPEKGNAPPLDEIRSLLATRALNPPSAESLAVLKMETLASGLRALDPYARYIPPTGAGVATTTSPMLGIEVFSSKSKIWLRPDPDGPASGAGIPDIGELRAINGLGVSSELANVTKQLDQAMQTGPVILTIADSSGQTKRDYRIRPRVFKASSVTWRRYGGWLILRIVEFVPHETSPGLFSVLVTKAKPDTKIILDLRGCSGGDLYESLDVAGLFIPAGLPLAETYDRSSMVRAYRSPKGRKTKLPAWLLIDSRTASSAEVLAGILQYHRRALLVGERSFGKCVSQTFASLSNGGGFWLTNLGVRFPNGTSCNGSGLNPDIPYPGISNTSVIDMLSTIPRY